jgi:DNA-binding transcriptional MerR regulator
MPPDAAYTIADLARLTGLNVRTIRYYLAQGLLPASGESGPGAHYGEGHLDRLRLTKRLQAQHQPLAEIRSRLAELTDAEVASLIAMDAEPSSTPETSALDYIRKVLGSPDASRGGPDSMAIGAYPLVAPSVAPAPPVAPASALGLARLLRSAAPVQSPAEVDAPSVRRARDMPRVGPAEVDDARAAEITHGDAAPPAAASSREMPANVERSQWERLSLGPNVELHVRRPLSRLEQRRVERLITIARQVLHEDQS